MRDSEITKLLNIISSKDRNKVEELMKIMVKSRKTTPERAVLLMASKYLASP
jgi:uncharacterized membrane protein YvbJ